MEAFKTSDEFISPACRDLIHGLNQRYREEWDRAERLQAELNDIKSARAWIIFRCLRALRRFFLPSPPSAEGPGFRGDPANAAIIPALTRSANATAKVSILIPFTDQLGLLRNCLRSLRRGAYRRLEFVLLDNGSTSPSMLRYLERMRRRRGFRVVVCPGEFNFARICNLGARHASGNYLLFLNNDTEVQAPAWLEHMLELAEHPHIGVVGATLLYPDGTLQHAGIDQMADGTWRHVHRGRKTTDADLQHARYVPAVSGACLMMRRDRFLELGGFDERFPITHNDVDLCLRARQRGWLTAITPHAQLMHFESLSRGYSRLT
jgi:GT2 family glycosyltransferase